MSKPPPPNKKGRPGGSASFSWRAFFQQTTTPVFVLGKHRRLRFANTAWERLTGLKLADVLGMVCSSRRHSTPVAAAMAPTPEAQAGRPDRVRRAAPPGRYGPPWWDVSFSPLESSEGIFGIVGVVMVVGEAPPPALCKVPPSLGTLRDAHSSRFTLDLFGGQSPACERFQAQLRHASRCEVPIWIQGEAGSGKETAARVIHRTSARRDRAFFGLDCAGLQPYLIESLLFGHGGQFGASHLGTLYLDDPSALPRDLQQKLADLFAEPKPDLPQLISGSSRTAAEEVAAGQLVPAFHTELSVLELRVPPLRERLVDLPRLAERLLPGIAIDHAVHDVLARQAWPGNLRELADVLAEASAAANGQTIRKEHLPRDVRVRAGLEQPPARHRPLTLDPLLEAVERRLIQLAMRRSNGQQTEAAELLGIFRARLARRLEALKLKNG
jgi:transcriptional regulator with PAS, ATPase and Fis domain